MPERVEPLVGDRHVAPGQGRGELVEVLGRKQLAAGAARELGEGLRAFLDAQPTGGDAPLWLVLLGHETFDGERARFNLRGPDVRALELAQWLEDFERPVAVVVCAASSGPFVNRP